MSPPTAIIAEDEKALRDELRQRLSELWPELLVIGEAGTGIEALQLLEKHAPDLMFLDIQMPGMTGLEIAHQAQGRCHIVFVTAYDAYAVAAFETGALDYVLKPLERERLRLAVDRVSQRLGSTHHSRWSPNFIAGPGVPIPCHWTSGHTAHREM